MPELMVKAGDLRTRITFQEPTVSLDAGGAQVPSWANVDSTPSVWSRWIYDHGQELIQAPAAKAVQRATVTVRYRSDILSTWRVVKGGSAWKIISPPENVQEGNRWTVFRVELVGGSL